MPGAFRCPSDLNAVKFRDGVGDYVERATAHTENARAIHEQRTTREHGEHSFVTTWENSKDLRLWAHEQELAQACLQASRDCHRYWWNASNKAHQHTLFCLARQANTRRAHDVLSLSLAQVASVHACHTRTRETHAPPGAPRLSALATCHASNAPGLPDHALNLETAPT